MLSNIKIFPRLFIGFGALILLVAGLSGFAVVTGQSSRSLFGAVNRLSTADTLDQRAAKSATWSASLPISPPKPTCWL